MTENLKALSFVLVLIVGAALLGAQASGQLDLLGRGRANNIITDAETLALLTPSPPPPNAAEINTQNQPVLGNIDAPIEIVEFVDFQCPYCKEFAQLIVPALKATYIQAGQVKLIIKDFPLENHANARNAALAVNCAHALGGNDAYFHLHDLLFDRQGDWDVEAAAPEIFREYAAEVGLDITKFNDCVQEKRPGSDIESDRRDGVDLGVNGTPTFFVNGEAFRGVPPTVEAMNEIIERKLQELES